jgi:hypothetical protein
MMRTHEMVDNPQHWPKWPVLPLKRRKGDLGHGDYLGFLVDTGPSPIYQVYIGCMFLPPTNMEIYTTLDELLDVWEVD